VDDQGGYLDVGQPVTPARGAVDSDGMAEPMAEDIGCPATCCTAISRLPASSKGYVP
jgi:hypothetical protein